MREEQIAPRGERVNAEANLVLAARMAEIEPFHVMDVPIAATTELKRRDRRIVHMEIGQPDFSGTAPVAAPAGRERSVRAGLGYIRSRPAFPASPGDLSRSLPAIASASPCTVANRGHPARQGRFLPYPPAPCVGPASTKC